MSPRGRRGTRVEQNYLKISKIEKSVRSCARHCIGTSNKNKKIHVRIHLTVTVIRFSQCGRYWKVHNAYHQHVQQRQLSRTVASVADHVTRVHTPPVFKAVAMVAVGKRASAINAAIGVVVVRAVFRVIPLFKRAESARGSCT